VYGEIMTSVVDPGPPGPSWAPAEPSQPAETAQPPVVVPARPDRFTRFVTMLYDRSPRWLAPLAALICIGGAAGYTLATDPTHEGAGESPTCILKMTTGLDCPGCGGTRAFWYLLHGDVASAARHHLVFVFAVPFLVYLYVAWAVKQVFGRKLPTFAPNPTVIGMVLAAWLVFAVLRNLPWAPFTWFYV
jgi:hypothetical protein